LRILIVFITNRGGIIQFLCCGQNKNRQHAEEQSRPKIVFAFVGNNHKDFTIKKLSVL
jgi:hypothetical protein